MRSLSERLWVRVDQAGGPDSCWPFQGYRDLQGYGRLSAGRRRDGAILAHRAAYLDRAGPIPDGLTVDHLCRNPPCCNPAHMELVTLAENSRRQAAARPPAATCRRGHPFTPESTGHTRTQRYCLVCRTATATTRRRVSPRSPTPAQVRRHARQQQYAGLRAEGYSQARAAAVVGVSQAAGSLWERKGIVTVAANLRAEMSLGGGVRR
jgi:hypothetical protein